MGIPGLLLAVRDAIEVTNISEYQGKRAGIDGFVWAHRGCLSCGREIAKGHQTRKYINYFMKQLQLLIDNRIHPLIVFDGDDFPAKRYTNEARRKKRTEHRKLAEEYEKRGLAAEAELHYNKSVEITPQILHPLFQELRRKGINFIVAPYEADAQLAFLANNNIIDFVITEDSDLLVYRCPHTLYKLEKNGNCHSLFYANIFKISEFSGMTHDMFVECCVLSGCDYLPSISKMGIRTAAKKMQIYHSGKAVLSSMRAEGKWDIPDNYESDFEKARLVFYQQRVFDPKTKTIHGIYDNKYTDIIGTNISNEEAIGIAYGRINPKTHEPFDDDLSYELESNSQKSTNTSLYSVKISTTVMHDFKSHSTSYNRIIPIRKPPINPLQPVNNTSTPKKYMLPSMRRFAVNLKKNDCL